MYISVQKNLAVFARKVHAASEACDAVRDFYCVRRERRFAP
jgi:hypothetical protein